MKYISLLLCLISLNSFAASFNKIDSGFVEWTINSKSELTATVYRTGIRFEMAQLNEIQRQRLTLFPSFSSMGKVAGFFRSSEKKSLEATVSYLSSNIEKFFNLELSDYPINYQVFSSSIEFSNPKCETKGVIFKKTVCTAQFENSAEVELLD